MDLEPWVHASFQDSGGEIVREPGLGWEGVKSHMMNTTSVIFEALPIFDSGCSFEFLKKDR